MDLRLNRPHRTRDWLMLVVLLMVGCNQPAGQQKVNASPTACADYAKKVCTEAGEQTGTCTSIKEATGLMSPAAISRAPSRR